MNLRVSKITDKRAYCYCCFHNDTSPSLVLTLEGEHAGEYYCYACGRKGQINTILLNKIKARKQVSKSSNSTTERAIDWDSLNSDYGLTYFYEGFILKPDRPFDVSLLILNHLNCGWDGSSFTFPMRNGDNEIIGIQRQFPNRKKLNVEGSHSGLFIPQFQFDSGKCVYICEGCSDTAVVLDLGFQAIGRSDSNHGNDFVKTWISNQHIKDVIIVADNDKPGIKGATKLSEELGEKNPKIIVPQCKDVREMIKNAGADETINFLQS